MSERTCNYCGKALPPEHRNGGRRRKFCSDLCRKRSHYSGVCPDCGAATYSGQSRPSVRCNTCAQRAKTFWTAEAIIEAVRTWAAAHGRQPYASDWKDGNQERGYPSTKIVQARFGSWSAGMAAAGFEARPVGRHAVGSR